MTRRPVHTVPVAARGALPTGVLPVPADWLDVLARVQRAYPGALLVGGCLRDHLTGTPPSDLDIAVPTGTLPGSGVPSVTAASAALGLALAAKFVRPPGSDSPVAAVYAGHDPTTGLPLDLVFSEGRGAQAALQRCDIGACAVCTDGRDAYALPAFFDDLAGQTLTVRRPNGGTPKHLAKIAQRYPTWAIRLHLDRSDTMPTRLLVQPVPSRPYGTALGDSYGGGGPAPSPDTPIADAIHAALTAAGFDAATAPAAYDTAFTRLRAVAFAAYRQVIVDGGTQAEALAAALTTIPAEVDAIVATRGGLMQTLADLPLWVKVAGGALALKLTLLR